MTWQNLCDDLIRRKIMDGPTKTIWRALYCKLNCRPIMFYTCQSFLYQSSPFAHITTHSSFNPLQTLQPEAQSIEDRFTQDQHKCSHIYHLLILVALIQQHNHTRQYIVLKKIRYQTGQPSHMSKSLNNGSFIMNLESSMRRRN